MSNESNEKIVRFRRNIQDALDRSERELELIAKLFHQHGYTDRAKKIYSAVLNMRQDRNKSADGQERR
jgi:hypothetical protein